MSGPSVAGKRMTSDELTIDKYRLAKVRVMILLPCVRAPCLYFSRLLGSIAGIGALQPLLRKVSGPLGKEVLSIPVPEGMMLDTDGNSIRKVRCAIYDTYLDTQVSQQKPLPDDCSGRNVPTWWSFSQTI